MREREVAEYEAANIGNACSRWNREGPVLHVPLMTSLILLASLLISAVAGLMQASTHSPCADDV